MSAPAFARNWEIPPGECARYDGRALPGCSYRSQGSGAHMLELLGHLGGLWVNEVTPALLGWLRCSPQAGQRVRTPS